MPLRVAVLASGRGTNLQAILDQLHGGGEVEVVAVASDKPGARALERAARRASRPPSSRRRLSGTAQPATLAIGRLARVAASRARRARRLHAAAQRRRSSRRFPAAIINVHPALLPSFPGLDAIGQAFRHGVRVSGVTVHFVDDGVDTGPIILQEPIELTYTRPIEEFEAHVHRVEHRAAAAGDRADRPGRSASTRKTHDS